MDTGKDVSDAKRNDVAESILRREATNRALRFAAPIAVQRLRAIVESRTAKHADIIAAAKVLLDRAGYVPPAAPKMLEPPLKQLSEMTPDELRKAVADLEAGAKRLEHELGDRATPVNAPNAPSQDGRDASFLD